MHNIEINGISPLTIAPSVVFLYWDITALVFIGIPKSYVAVAILILQCGGGMGVTSCAPPPPGNFIKGQEHPDRQTDRQTDRRIIWSMYDVSNKS